MIQGRALSIEHITGYIIVHGSVRTTPAHWESPVNIPNPIPPTETHNPNAEVSIVTHTQGKIRTPNIALRAPKLQHAKLIIPCHQEDKRKIKRIPLTRSSRQAQSSWSSTPKSFRRTWQLDVSGIRYLRSSTQAEDPTARSLASRQAAVYTQTGRHRTNPRR